MHSRIVIAFVFLLTIITSFSSLLPIRDNCVDAETLQIVLIVFRHGDRTPTSDETYPTDPEKDNQFAPYGPNGQLILDGKRHSYNLGKQIRKLYGCFMGTQYSFGLINTTTSDSPRTKMTAQAVHAGIFPPMLHEMLGMELFWQPIPYHTIPWQNDDKLMMYVRCPLVYQFDEVVPDEQTEELYSYLCENTGIDCNKMDTSTVFNIYENLFIKEQMGFALPSWADSVYPEPLRKASLKLWNESNKYRLRIAAGPLVKHLTEICDEKAQNITAQPKTKMFLFAGHDSNIAALLGAFGKKITEVIDYNSAIYIELHLKNGKYGVKVFYQNGVNRSRKVLKIKNCGEWCPLSKFKELTRSLYEPMPECVA